jgi:hypothetical protein
VLHGMCDSDRQLAVQKAADLAERALGGEGFVILAGVPARLGEGFHRHGRLLLVHVVEKLLVCQTDKELVNRVGWTTAASDRTHRPAQPMRPVEGLRHAGHAPRQKHAERGIAPVWLSDCTDFETRRLNNSYRDGS